MDWKEHLSKIEQSKDWKSAIALMQDTISENDSNVETGIFLISAASFSFARVISFKIISATLSFVLLLAIFQYIPSIIRKTSSLKNPSIEVRSIFFGFQHFFYALVFFVLFGQHTIIVIVQAFFYFSVFA